MDALRVVLVEDSVLLREGLALLLEEAGLEVVGSFGEAEPALAAIAELRPEMAILDVRMPPSFTDEGIRAAVRLRAEQPQLGILILSQYVESVYAQELFAGGEGGVGYLLKDRVVSLGVLTEAIERIHAGGTVLDPAVVARLVAARRDPLEALTPRERDVLEAMAEGASNTAIAERLHVSVGTVEKRVNAVFTKLGLEASASEHRRVLAVLRWLRQH